MNLFNLGYDKPLYILPFDHRSTFAQKMFGLKSTEQLSLEQTELIKEFKMLVYKGFKDALEKGIPTDYGAILCDEQFGSEILVDARHNGFITILTIEKSGEEEFKFQYGEDFPLHIERFAPNFTKVLVKYNPDYPEDLKKRQKDNLIKISNYSHEKNYKFLLEVLVNPSKQQLYEVGGDSKEYDKKLRPRLTVEVIKDFQGEGIEPDIWKMEGLEKKEDYREIVETARREGRSRVSLVILGRGAEEEQVEEWLKIGAGVEGVVGFAVGRTAFWDALEKFYNGLAGKAEVIETVSNNFRKFYDIFVSSK